MLFCNIDLLDENFAFKRGQYVGVKDGKIAYIAMPSRRRITASVTTANTVC
nr:hypothetical protein [Butyricicoccus sp. OF13-6]